MIVKKNIVAHLFKLESMEREKMHNMQVERIDRIEKILKVTLQQKLCNRI